MVGFILILPVVSPFKSAHGVAAPSPSPTSKPLDVLEGNINQLKQRLTSPVDSREIATGVVRLDGHKLFTITAPAVKPENQGKGTSTPISQRVQIIEKRLRQLVQSGLDSQTLEVSSRVDPQSGLPVLHVNDRYLMTVTNQDAALHSGDLEQWVADLTQIIQDALVRAYRERQPEFLQRQAGIAGGIIILMIGGGLWITHRQRRLKMKSAHHSKREGLQSEADDGPASSGQMPPSTLAEQPVEIQEAQAQQQLKSRKDTSGIQLLLLQIGKYGLWAGGSFSLLGLFPQSRWLQLAIVSSLKIPLQLVVIGVGAYLLIRISFVAIDQFRLALTEQSFLSLERSRRRTLRAATIARVMQGLSVVSITVIGLLLALSVIGVDLVPLLAGISVVGLAFSFASQSLIKDTINGFFILLEDQYGVGDVIIVGNVSGFVENMNLRITQLRNTEGCLITIPNSMVDIVQNLSKDWSRVDLAIDVAYSEDPEQALAIVREVASDLYRDREWSEQILEDPEVLGIDKLDHMGMQIRTWIKTVPLAQWKVAREFRRRLKLKLDQAQMEIGAPQQIITAPKGEDFLHLDNNKTLKDDSNSEESVGIMKS